MMGKKKGKRTEKRRKKKATSFYCQPLRARTVACTIPLDEETILPVDLKWGRPSPIGDPKKKSNLKKKKK
ncbi:hypothetical protein PVIIG_04790 [Plasmodium vivax India VII]|uniref:Uncharacterized protein n=5 Tax=Plasmodium vivax TaxID=5855 RepID=A5KB22_PLAVS|nr:hypothetical protein PVX_098030 [Plasmodium vivax]KMZ79991.1 hypothetical protein PVIIG_04790 [Plasmodium vivax India VII]KMZ86363.1 hypothetical protein PVBG_01886 [Plasmodium vivax Brazil I]KMZ92724.1 hypothetical protein PVMG_01312 [Plasmodium vivax Mauritania I]KMZ99049.1 hypothetical protein PVNG_05175 [Plasmodium vivax North Korean]EDL43539.1 hypothetical protein PVX_098030 [Plasmodium vivax]|eukprot:XP_001613266.1 hypothetical protein [Plasmodium vivax Sal-1]